jgi:hypothetical protein
MSAIDLPSKEELIARSEHLALAVETAFREWLLAIVLARETSPEFLIQLVRINQNIDQLKLKKAMLKLKEREVIVKERGADAKMRELELKAQIAADDRAVRDREVAFKEKRLEFQKSQASSTKEPADAAAASSPGKLEMSTEELVAMEWDLRSILQFGDLRPFDWYTGLKTIYFPDRSLHPAPPIPNYPDDLVRTESMVARPDGVFILPTPVSQLPKDWEKMLMKPEDRPPYTPVPPVLENGQAQWQLFIQPAYAHTNFPYNTLLPEGWVYGDPIPGMPEEFA